MHRVPLPRHHGISRSPIPGQDGAAISGRPRSRKAIPVPRRRPPSPCPFWPAWARQRPMPRGRRGDRVAGGGKAALAGFCMGGGRRSARVVPVISLTAGGMRRDIGGHLRFEGAGTRAGGGCRPGQARAIFLYPGIFQLSLPNRQFGTDGVNDLTWADRGLKSCRDCDTKNLVILSSVDKLPFIVCPH